MWKKSFLHSEQKVMAEKTDFFHLDASWNGICYCHAVYWDSSPTSLPLRTLRTTPPVHPSFTFTCLSSGSNSHSGVHLETTLQHFLLFFHSEEEEQTLETSAVSPLAFWDHRRNMRSVCKTFQILNCCIVFQTLLQCKWMVFIMFQGISWGLAHSQFCNILTKVTRLWSFFILNVETNLTVLTSEL